MPGKILVLEINEENNFFQGDSGGAMSCQIPRDNPVYEQCQGYFVRGLTSFGLGCNQIGTPGVYVDLSNKGIENWIKDIQRVSQFSKLPFSSNSSVSGTKRRRKSQTRHKIRNLRKEPRLVLPSLAI